MLLLALIASADADTAPMPSKLEACIGLEESAACTNADGPTGTCKDGSCVESSGSWVCASLPGVGAGLTLWSLAFVAVGRRRDNV
jgi:hypothetical protein